MNVLVIGSGGREHALAWKIFQSPKLSEMYCSPGNPGIAKVAENVMLQNDEIINFCKKKNIDLVVIGPEQPLVEGLADKLREENIKVFGPNKNAAIIEGDKSFSKDLMQKYKIPTAAYRVFDKKDYEKVVTYLNTIIYPTVVKVSGLAAGKGVIICKDKIEAEDTVKSIFFDERFGESGAKIVIEEFMEGQEASIFAVTDGDNYVLLPSSQDHKRIFDNDEGPNTGGMGAYSPAPLVTNEILELIKTKVVERTLSAMKSEGRKYSGCLYCGLMIKDNKPRVVEFNCRFGDPETQAVLPLIEGDFLELLYSSAIGNLSSDVVKYNGGSSVCVVTSSKGYPGAYEKGYEIIGLENADSEDVVVFHAGTKEIDGKILTNGGRVLGVTSINKKNNLKQSKEIVYDALEKINFEGMFYRKDISDKAFLSY
ncbi:MAG: phosphoribosylamine--glycine ligase [Ignavibacteria bacterium]|jgi:phosphoribosylamine--glycine ligase